MGDREGQKDTEKTKDQTENNSCPGTIQNTPNNSKITENKQKNCFNKQINRRYAIIGMWCAIVMAACTFAIVIVTWVYTHYAGQQVCQMKKAVNQSEQMRKDSNATSQSIMAEMTKQSVAMRETAEANKITAETTRLRDRAFVYFLDPIIFPYPSSEKIVTWGLTIQLQNSGSMPARGVSVRCAHVEFSTTQDVPDPWILARGKWYNVQVPDVIGSQSIHRLPTPDISIGTMNRAKKMESVIFIFMEATYLDGFVKKRRVTQMSRVLGYDAEGGKSVRYTRTHNCSDDDCKK